MSNSALFELCLVSYNKINKPISMYICCVYTYIYTRSFLYLLSRRRTSGEILSQAGQSVPEWLEKALMGSQRVLWYGAYPRNPQNSETARKNKGSGGCLGEICWMTNLCQFFLGISS